MDPPRPIGKLDTRTPATSMTHPDSSSSLVQPRTRPSLKIIPTTSRCPPAEGEDGISTRQSNSESSGLEERRILEMRTRIRAELAESRAVPPTVPFPKEAQAAAPLPTPPTKRVGKVRYCFGGRFLFGPDMRLAMVAFLMIIVPSVVYDAWSLPWMIQEWTGGWILALIAILLELLILALFMRTALSDPGIVPREADLSGVGTGGWYDQITPRNPPKHQDVVIHGHLFKMKYCLTCKFYRPPRCVHCSTCDNCVDKFDHHCPWIGNCVGRRNYRSFICFIFTSSIFLLLVMSTSPVKFAQLFQARNSRSLNDDEGNGMRTVWLKAWDSIVLTIFCIGVLWFVLGLAGYHLYLIMSNQTTYEQIKGFYEEKLNPWDRGFGRNLRELLLKRRRPKFTFRPRGSIIYADMVPINACPGSGRIESGGIARRNIILRPDGTGSELAYSLSLKRVVPQEDRMTEVSHPRLQNTVYHQAEIPDPPSSPRSRGSFESIEAPDSPMSPIFLECGSVAVPPASAPVPATTPTGQELSNPKNDRRLCSECNLTEDCLCNRRVAAGDIFYRRRANTDVMSPLQGEEAQTRTFSELDRPSAIDTTIMSWLRKAGDFGKFMSRTDLGRWTCVLPED